MQAPMGGQPTPSLHGQHCGAICNSGNGCNPHHPCTHEVCWHTCKVQHNFEDAQLIPAKMLGMEFPWLAVYPHLRFLLNCGFRSLLCLLGSAQIPAYAIPMQRSQTCPCQQTQHCERCHCVSLQERTPNLGHNMEDPHHTTSCSM